MASLSGVFNNQEFTDTGVPLAGGRVYTYAQGTTTQKDVYTDIAGTIPHTYTSDGAGGLYIGLNARGELPAPMYFGTGPYDICLKRADGSTVWTRRADGVGQIAVDLAASTGASMIGFSQLGIGAVPRSMQAKGRDFITLSDFGVTGTGDETTKAQAAFDYAIATSQNLFIDRPFTASKIVIDGANGLVIFSKGSITGLAAGTFDAVLTIKNSGDVYTVGRLPVSAAYNSGYACAVAIYTDNATQAAKIGLSDVIVSAAKLGFRIGRASEPHALISEITIRGGYANGCPAFLEAYGTQTVVNIIGYQAISDLGANPSGWSALNRIHTRSIGANVRYIGGECLLTDVTTGIGFSLEPIADATYGNRYSTVECIGVDVEVASQLLVARNPAAVPSPVAGTGAFNLSNCSGVHTQDFSPWLVTAADFTGSIRVQNNKLFCTATRSNSTIECLGNADVYIDDHSFGTGFLQGLSALVGGIVHFGRCKIAEAVNATSQSFASSTQAAVKYATFNIDAQTGRFAANYNPATGVFTVPAGGLKDVEVFASLHTTVPSAPLDLAVFVNGSQRVPFPTSIGGASCNGWASGTTSIGNLSAGDTIDVRAMQSGSASNSNGGALDKLIIHARN